MAVENDGMEWLPAEVAASSADSDALNVAGSSARVSLFNEVLRAFEQRASVKGTTRRALAKKMGVAPQAISRLLLHPSNMTIETAARLLFSLDRRLVVSSEDLAPSKGSDLTPSDHIAVQVSPPQRVAESKGTAFRIGQNRYLVLSGNGNEYDGFYAKDSTSNFKVQIESHENILESSTRAPFPHLITRVSKEDFADA